MSNATPRTIALGTATLTLINVGDMMVDLAQEIGVPESEWLPLYREGFAGSRPYSSQCAHIALVHASILVDAGDYVQAIALEPLYLPPVYLSPVLATYYIRSQKRQFSHSDFASAIRLFPPSSKDLAASRKAMIVQITMVFPSVP
jgi:hypothetical protein